MRHEYLSVNTLKSNRISAENIVVGDIAVGGGGYITKVQSFAPTVITAANAVKVLFTISGAVRMKLLPRVDVAVTAAGAPAPKLLFSGTAVRNLITATAKAILTTKSFWVSSTTAHYNPDTSRLFDRIANPGKIKLKCSAATAAAGQITFHCWWEPITPGATVVAAA